MSRVVSSSPWRKTPDGDWERDDGVSVSRMIVDGLWVWRVYIQAHAESVAGNIVFVMLAHSFEVSGEAMSAADWWFPEDRMRGGVELIAAERERQIDEEGWTVDHDDDHVRDQMALAAMCYACPDGLDLRSPGNPWKGNPPIGWPWDARWWKPSPDDRIRELVKAGALIAAEIDRLQRGESA